MPVLMLAQTDEIQVYDGEIAPPGIFNLMVHNNFTPKGRTVPDYPWRDHRQPFLSSNCRMGLWRDAVVRAGTLSSCVPRPIHRTTARRSTASRFANCLSRPNAHDHTFFYAANFEFSVNHHYWESRTITSEIRPIVGLHLHPWDFIYNPIVDTDYTGGLGNLQYNPSGRVAYNFNDRWAVAAEEYDGFGPLHGVLANFEAISRGLGDNGLFGQQVSRS